MSVTVREVTSVSGLFTDHLYEYGPFPPIGFAIN
jgi:hypothetical protein